MKGASQRRTHSVPSDMRDRLFDQLHYLFRVVALLLLFVCSGLKANTRILEIPLALSADTRSEFATQIQLLSAGRLVVEILLNPNPDGRGFLSASIIRPDRSEAARKEAAGAFRLEYHATEPEIDQLVLRGTLSWTVKVKQGSAPAGDVAGRLRITVPATPRQLVDTQFTLLGSGNAQEIPFVVPAPGKIQVTTSWETDATAAGTTQPVPLTLSLSHPGLAQTHARRQSRSPQRRGVECRKPLVEPNPEQQSSQSERKYSGHLCSSFVVLARRWVH